MESLSFGLTDTQAAHSKPKTSVAALLAVIPRIQEMKLLRKGKTTCLTCLGPFMGRCPTSFPSAGPAPSREWHPKHPGTNPLKMGPGAPALPGWTCVPHHCPGVLLVSAWAPSRPSSLCKHMQNSTRVSNEMQMYSFRG